MAGESIWKCKERRGLDMELLIGIVGLYFVALGAIILIVCMAYGYWGLSIGMAPILWILMSIGALVGLICTLKNAFKAARAIRGKGVE